MIERRDVLKAAAALVVLNGIANAEETGHEHASGAEHSPPHDLARAIAGCVTEGNICMQHCLVALATGDTTLAECSKTVRDMLAICGATQTLVASNSPRTKAAVQLCVDACTDCEAACRKHAEKHAVCKACADACAATIKAGRAFVA